MQNNSSPQPPQEILNCCLCNLTTTICTEFLHVNDGFIKHDGKEKAVILVISHLLQSHPGSTHPGSTVILRSQYICNFCIQELSEYDELVERLQKIQKRFKQMMANKSEEPEIQEQFFPYQSEEITNNKDVEFNDYLTEGVDFENNIIEETDEFSVYSDDINVTDVELNSQREWQSPIKEKILSVEPNYEDSEEFKTRCSKCSRVFFNKIRFKDHVEFEHRTADPNVLVCRICHRLFRSLEVLLLHKNIHEGKTEKQCRYCENSYTKKENVLRHMQKTHWHSNLQCDTCGEAFPNRHALSNHVQKHVVESGQVECEICSQVFKNKRTLKTHMPTHDKERIRHKCNFCLKSFTEKYRLKLHCQNQHSITVRITS